MNRPLTVAYIFSQYPRLTETFLHREVAGLRQAGLRVKIHALFAGPVRSEADSFRWWEAARLMVALPREIIRQPALLRDGWRALRRARFRSAENFFATVWAAIYAVCRAPRFRANRPDIIHGVWATESSSAAAILSRLCGIPFSFAAHAFDVYKQGGDACLDAKLAAAAFIHTTTQANVAYLRQLVPQARVLLARHGLNQLPASVGKDRPPGPVRILSVGRLVPKKGHIHQLAACALLKQWGVPFEARIIGDGELRRELQRQIDDLRLAGTVTLCGAQTQEQVQEIFPWADIFWHTGVVDAQGDRDGLPNVIPEAFAHSLPVICGPVAGPLEAVAHEVTGLVVDVTNPVALATAVRRLAEDEPLRRRLGENGRHWAEENFLVSKNAALLAQAFREAAGKRAAAPTIVYIFEHHPSLAQTFLKREITELMRQGFRVEVCSLVRRRLGAPPPAPGASAFAEYDQLAVDYFRWWEAFKLFSALPREWGWDAALLRDGWRMLRQYRPKSLGNFMINIWAAIFAVCRARQFRQRPPQMLHGIWATGPATAAAILNRLCDIPFSVGTDGYDVYDHGGDQFLEPKLRAAGFVQANFAANAAYLRERAPEARIVLARRGLDRLPPARNCARVPGPIRILSVARLAPKKGHIHQLAACALLKQWGVPFEARIIGDGELGRQLQRRIKALELADVVTLCGGQQHEQVQEAYPWADILWHTGVINPSGNRDGLPNVIPEAFSHKLPVICGLVPGATEAVIHNETGLVVDVADPVALATAVRRLAEDAPLRRRLGENGRRWVEENFLVSKNVAILARAFHEAAARHATKPPPIVYVLMKHPSLSQTFLKREIAELIRQGLRVEVHSLWRVRMDAPPAALTVHYFRWWHAIGLIVALPRELGRDPALLRDGWRMVKQYRPTTTPDLLKNLWGAMFAVCRARRFRRHRVQLIHGAWAASPATAAAILSRLCGVPFSFGAHAYDIYEHGGDQFLDAKLRAARFVHTTTKANVAYLRERVPETRVVLARRGLEQLPTAPERARLPGPIRILSVARLAPIKGHHHQLAACALLKQWKIPFAVRIVGDGELKRELQQKIESLGLADVVTLCGGQQHEQVQEAFAWADIFWHTGVMDARGNRDGLPNVIPEAFAHQLPVICSPEPGATEAVIDRVTGLVVDVTDPVTLAGAVQRLIDDEALRRRLGENGRRWVEENFLVSKNAGILAESFRRAVQAHDRPATDREAKHRPLISFIIPVHNCLALTKDCLKSLEQTVGDRRWEALIVDDCSTDGTGEFLAGLPSQYRVLRNETRQSYSASNNRAAAIARGEFLGFLNNDIILTPGWLEPMLHIFEAHPRAGVVGNVQRNPRTGRYDHMGVVFSPAGLHKCFGKHFFFKPLTGSVEWRAVTAACCLVRRSTFQEAGGFDESFVHGCEDVDLCLRLGQLGYKHYVATDSVIYHYVSSSEGRREFEQRNKQRLLERWAESVQRSLTPRERLLYGINFVLRLLCRPKA